MITLNWTSFKAMLVQKSISAQEHDRGGAYELFGFDGPLTIRCMILKEDPANADQTDYETNFQPYKNSRLGNVTTETFSAKFLPDGRKLFARVTGAQFSVDVGNNNCDFSIPFPTMKIDGIEILGGELGDSVNLFVLDTPNGALSSIPNFSLNQFGFTTFVAKDYYLRQSKYDADLIEDMTIRTDYYSVSAKTIYINYLIHEVKI